MRHMAQCPRPYSCPLCRLRAAARRARQHYAEVQRQRRELLATFAQLSDRTPQVRRAVRKALCHRFTRANVGGICPCSAPGDDCPRIMECECDCHFDPSDAMEGQ